MTAESVEVHGCRLAFEVAAHVVDHSLGGPVALEHGLRSSTRSG